MVPAVTQHCECQEHSRVLHSLFFLSTEARLPQRVQNPQVLKDLGKTPQQHCFPGRRYCTARESEEALLQKGYRYTATPGTRHKNHSLREHS